MGMAQCKWFGISDVLMTDTLAIVPGWLLRSGSLHMPVLGDEVGTCVERPGTHHKYNHLPEARRLAGPSLFAPLQTACMSESQVVSTTIDDRDPNILYLPDPSDWTVRTLVGAQLHGDTDTSRLVIGAAEMAKI